MDLCKSEAAIQVNVDLQLRYRQRVQQGQLQFLLWKVGVPGTC